MWLTILSLMLKPIAVIGAVITMIYGLHLIFRRLKEKDQGFGPNSVRVIGTLLFLPILFMLALLTTFQTETLAALLGTIAGYIMSNSKSDDS